MSSPRNPARQGHNSWEGHSECRNAENVSGRSESAQDQAKTIHTLSDIVEGGDSTEQNRNQILRRDAESSFFSCEKPGQLVQSGQTFSQVAGYPSEQCVPQIAQGDVVFYKLVGHGKQCIQYLLFGKHSRAAEKRQTLQVVHHIKGFLVCKLVQMSFRVGRRRSQKVAFATQSSPIEKQGAPAKQIAMATIRGKSAHNSGRY